MNNKSNTKSNKKVTTGVLLIHGVLGSPQEFSPLVEALESAGYHAHAMSQLGHGDRITRESFQDSEFNALLNHCHAEYNILAHEVDRIVLVGHSMGGIYGLRLAATQPQKLMGIAALSTPFSHTYNVHPENLLSITPKTLLKGLSYMGEQVTGYPRPKISIAKLPQIRTQTNQLLSALQHELPHVNVPVQLAHAEDDLTIPYSEMNKIANQLHRSPDIQTHTLTRCGHQPFPHTKESPRITQLVLDFIQRLEAS